MAKTDPAPAPAHEAGEGEPAPADGADETGDRGLYDPASRRVALLPEALANQIAAGEVVERPASVVKELVENALDAGASRILVDIEAAGKALIRIVDDGVGMSRDDAALAVLRHATSKVRSAEDLERIGTLGFRGEALPSIASVSRFLLVTRREDAEAATTVRIDGGSAPVLGVAAAPTGTRIEVRDLFWNVPARLKFLKTDNTETQHVAELIKGMALGHPRVHFRLGTGGKAPALDLPPVRRLVERVAQVLGHEVSDRLHEVSEPGPPVRVAGFVSGPRGAKATASSLICFVNGRRVKDKVLYHAAVSAFGPELLVGRFPQAVLWVHLDPADVDVNVHPTKAEVRFRRPDEVHTAVVAAIQAMLRRRPWAERDPLPLDSALETGPPPMSAPRPEGRPAPHHEPRPEPRPQPLPLPRSHVASPRAAYEARPRPHPTALSFEERPSALFGLGAPTRTATRPEPAEARPAAPASKSPPIHRPLDAARPAAPAAEARARVLGFIRGALMVVDDGEGLALIDLEAAVERLTAARLLALPEPVPPQPLLVPARLDLAPHEARSLESKLPLIATLGVWIEPFGGPTYQVLGLPAAALRASPARVLAALAAVRDDEATRAGLAQAIGHALARTATGEALIGLVAPSAESFAADTLALPEGRDRRGRRAVARLPLGEITRRLEG